MQRLQHKEILICIDKDNLSIPIGAIGAIGAIRENT
jgi:hypothetical protein